VEEKINLQRADAKPYQVKQVRAAILKARLRFKTMTKYEVIVYWSEEDEAFVAEVPELPGCAAHGPTQDRALSNAQDAIRLWIDTANEFGDPVPEPKGRRLLLA